MAEEKKQVIVPPRRVRFSSSEVQLIKSTFKDNEDLLKSLQKVFLQVQLNIMDLTGLRVLEGNTKLHKILRKTFLPQLDDDVSFNDATDSLALVDFQGKMHEDVVLHIKSNELLRNYYGQQLKVIEKAEYQKKQKIIFSEFADIKDKTDWQIYIDTLARNNLISTLKERLNNLYIMANIQELSPEQIMKNKEMDSSK